MSSYRPIGRMSWLIIGVGGRACHLELSLDTRLEESAGVSVSGAPVWVLVIPAPRPSPPPSARSLALGAASSGRWTATLGSLNECDYAR